MMHHVRGLGASLRQMTPLWRALVAIVSIGFAAGLVVSSLQTRLRAVEVRLQQQMRRLAIHERIEADSITQLRTDLAAGLAVLRAMGRATCRETPQIAERYDYPCADLVRPLPFPRR